MDPEEKSEELYNKFRVNDVYGEIVEEESIRLAICCVDEVIESLEGLYRIFWFEVRTELKIK